MDIDNKNIFFYNFTEPTLPSTIKETTPATRLATKSPQSENGMIPVNYILKFHTWGPVNFLTLLQQHCDRYMYSVVGIVLPNFDNRGRVGKGLNLQWA